MKFLNRRKHKITCFEKFFSKIFRNGLKLRFLKFFKNFLILFRILKNSFKSTKINNLNFSYNIIEENMFEKFLPEYSITYSIKKNFKERRKEKNLKSAPLKSHKKISELFKWLYLTIYKIPVRTIQLRLFYLFFCFKITGANVEKLREESKQIFAENVVSFKRKFRFKRLKKLKFRQKKKIKLNEARILAV